MFWMVWYGVQEIELEHDFPTPVEWGFRARWDGRNGKCVLWRISARGFAREGEWGLAYEYLSNLQERLENPRREGKRLKEQEVAGGNGALLVDGVGKIGYDINAKSEQWKQGYWECLMGLAKVAEYLDGHVKRKGKELNSKTKLYTWENIPGPQNPRPVAVPWDKDGAHLNVPTFSEVEAAMEAPEAYYLRILTSKGLSNRQRLDAALACADWYDYKNLRETAAGMYDWAIDIAAGGLPEGADHVVDIQTGVINAGKERFVSENLLRASTALGVWHAKHGEVKEALPIFLSVLRARKALPPAPPHFQSLASGQKRMTPAEREAQTTRSVVQGYLQNFIDFFRESDKLNVQTSGDEQPFHSLKEACEEVGVMTYIGEILFATGGQEREKGLSWTRDSVDAAEAVLWLMDDQGAGQGENGRDRCRECLSTGLENWQQMARQMTRLARQKKEEAQQSRGWLGLGIGQSSAVEKATEEIQKWEEEEGQIELKRQKTASLLSILKPTGNPFGMISTVT
ncbi:hypothetical protein LTS08_002109 [Lithohypha guttulata]|nr:hypothetical protein LTS08_002109 [Lithohypha guttulata]